jgi:hypothetical protein
MPSSPRTTNQMPWFAWTFATSVTKFSENRSPKPLTLPRLGRIIFRSAQDGQSHRFDWTSRMTHGISENPTRIKIEQPGPRSQGPASGPLPANATFGKRFVSPQEFGQLTGWSPSTVRRRIRDRSLPVIQPGGPRTLVLIDVASLSAAQAASSRADSGSAEVAPTGEPYVDSIPIDPKPRPRGPIPRWKQFT